MESTMAIKVKYGEVLRRFSVRVYENNRLDLDMNELRAKILDLFNFSSDTDVTLTYIDEDGDIVTLVNDDDLHDVMRQRLKFLRIDVHLRNEKKDQSHDRSSDGSSTPLMTARGQRSFQNVHTNLSDVLKSLPEPLPEFFTQFLLDIASKAAITSPVLAELAQSFIRLGNIHLNSVSQSPSVPETSTQNVETESSRAPLGADSKASKHDAFHHEAGSNSKCTGLAYKDSKIINRGSVTKNIDVDAPASDDLNALPRFTVENSPIAAPRSSSFDGKTREENISDASLFQRVCSLHNSLNNSLKATYLDDSSIKECPFSGVPVATGSSMFGTVGIDPVISSSGYIESGGNMFPQGPESSSSYFESVGSMIPIGRATRNNSDYIESSGSMFHRGVICDGCGARPITGPRFKSQVKDNYDLCIVCFSEMGNEADYIRIDRPVSCRYPRMKALNRRHSFAGPRIVNTLKNLGKQTRLDCRFVTDVNVLDGTVMAPSARFTKIWRLCNNGSLSWPRGTQLVWTGGDNISRSMSVEVEVPADGLPVGREIEIAVDFIAPPFSGEFTSYWRLSSPSGQKFGQRVWVIIQVDAALGWPDCNNSQALDLNFPPIVIGESSDLNGHEGVEKNSTPVIPDGVLFPSDSSPSPNVEPVKPDHSPNVEPVKPDHSPNVEPVKPDHSPIVELVKPDHNQPERETELRFLVNEDMLVGKGPSTSNQDKWGHYSTGHCPGTPVSYPLIDFSDPIPAANSPPIPPPSPKASPSSSENVTASSSTAVEETLLKTLVDMGFDQIDLNKEVLKRNEYDLEKSVDELCGVAEWDPLLEELQEMGFGDKEMNRILLMKNNGSMKRVVMELIYGEKV